jgi:putative addiction module component (TIGR02574 family)
MNEGTTALLNRTLQLPESERAWLAQQLLHSLPTETEDSVDDRFLAELERRAAEADQQPDMLVPWPEVKRM